MNVGEPEPGGKDVDRLFETLQRELRAIAARQLSRERPDHTLQPTALVHEAYLRLVKKELDWKDRAHFLATAARAIRQVLIDHARRRQMGKRVGQSKKVTLHDAIAVSDHKEVDFMTLHDALETLAKLNKRHAAIVELRFFGGMEVKEIAHVLEVSRRTVERDLRWAKTWLRRELSKEEEG